ncbi:MAG: hypothetical protein ACO3A2_06155 [Bdellovibrionia bacterium]
MLRFIQFLIRITVMSLLILVLGNALQWRGRTISDQVKIQMAHAERSETFESLQHWAQKLSKEAKQGFFKKPHFSPPVEEFHSQEKQKLKSLIQRIHSSSDPRGN